MARLFTIASDEAISSMISGAKEWLVLITPGLSKQVASVLAACIKGDRSPSMISVIMDIDPEVCRLGFGDIDAIDLLRSALQSRGLDLQMQKGVRIGVVIADSDILIYSPTARLIESGSNSEEKPNAIRISEGGADEIALACGAGKDALPIQEQEVGVEIVNNDLLEETRADLRENPPRQFDLARLERVFNYKLEFVEFSVSRFRLNTRTVSLPAELLGLAEKNLQDRLRNTFRVFETGTPFEFEVSDPADARRKLKISEKSLSKHADNLRKDYLIPLGSASYGKLILKRRKAEFQEKVRHLGSLVNLYAGKVRQGIAEKIGSTRTELVDALFSRVKAAPPPSWLQRSVEGELKDEVLRQKLEEEVDRAFEDIEQSFNPTVACVFKGVNYETITSDKHFRERIEAYFGDKEAANLLSEYDASRAQEQLHT
jgi:hypothetical protein